MKYCFLLFCFAIIACQNNPSTKNNPLAGKVICVDAGHGGTADTDSYRVGLDGEREEWINLRVAKVLQHLLDSAGAKVVMTRTQDANIPLATRAAKAIEAKADAFLSIHHNATADTSVNFPIIYFHGNASENQASTLLAQQVGRQLLMAMYGGDTLISIASDHTIFPNAGTAVLRQTYGIPAIIGEASFFTNPSEEHRLKDEAYNQQEAQAYLQALTAFFSEKLPPVKEKYSTVKIPVFTVLQEADRMKPEAKRWLEDYQEGKTMSATSYLDSAYQLLTRSTRSFPDSYVAKNAHLLRSELLNRMDSTQQATNAEQRAYEFYVPLTQ